MSRLAAFLYGIASYFLMFLSLCYMFGFLANMFVPKSIDSGTAGPLLPSLIINSLLIASFGITHSEYLIKEGTGEVYLVETAIRGGGVFISSDLIPLSCGIDVNKLIIELVSGRRRKVRIDGTEFSNRAAGYVCFSLPEGVISRVEGIGKIRSLPGALLPRQLPIRMVIHPSFRRAVRPSQCPSLPL